jgi:hypothetical protein
MKNTALLLTFLLSVTHPSFSWSKKTTRAASASTTKVLIVGLNDNVKSNYYVDNMIVEETGIQADSIDQEYNSIISRNIAAAADGSCTFVPGNNDASYNEMIGKISVTGEGEDCTSSLANISAAELQTALQHADASYLLVLNQHYLKWQKEPMHTVFHIVSYTLYDKDRKQVLSGNQYFTTMSLEKPEKLKQLSRKSTSRIASSIARSLAE